MRSGQILQFQSQREFADLGVGFERLEANVTVFGQRFEKNGHSFYGKKTMKEEAEVHWKCRQ